MIDELLHFSEVRISLPRKYILRCYYKKTCLIPKEGAKMRGKLAQIEKKINLLLHAQSIVEKTLLKDSHIPSPPLKQTP